MTRNSIPNEMFDVLCQIGEVASIMQDIAAREISDNKPIAGTAIDMLGRLIASHVERGMEFTPDRAVSATDPKPTPKPDDYTARADSAWPGGLDLRGLHGALSGVVTCLCALQDMTEGVDLDGDAFEPLLTTLTPWRDRTLAARDILEHE